MNQSVTERRMVEVTVPVDAELLEAVDNFVQEFPEFDRGAIVDEALRMWYAHEKSVEAEFAAPQSSEERAELRAWRNVQAAAAERIFRPR